MKKLRERQHTLGTLLLFIDILSITALVPTKLSTDSHTSRYKSLNQACPSDYCRDESFPNSSKRRRLLDCISTAATTTFFGAPLVSSALLDDDEPNMDCLLDLAPCAENWVRVYLCRHGQTEKNRLDLIQGARVNAPLNERGRAESARLGMALDRLGGTCPRVMMHSQLLRSKQTAQVAIETMSRHESHMSPLPSLRSIDYGPLAGGREASEVKEGMLPVYSAWTAGYIDKRPEGGGESCREVLNRAAVALKTLVKVASDNGGAVAAISHSTNLRMLLATVMEIPLKDAATLVQQNGCINVIDFCQSGPYHTLDSTSNIFYEKGPTDFQLSVPVGSVLRINEHRHLNDMCRLIPRA